MSRGTHERSTQHEKLKYESCQKKLFINSHFSNRMKKYGETIYEKLQRSCRRNIEERLGYNQLTSYKDKKHLMKHTIPHNEILKVRIIDKPEI